MTNRTHIIALAIVSLWLTHGLENSAQGQSDQINRANQALVEGNIDQALAQYNELQQANPVNPLVAYNKGVALYRQGKMEEARACFADALDTNDATLAAKSGFNLGNCSYATAVQQMESDPPAAIESLQSAIEHYRGALQSNASDTDARTNIELAHRLIQQLNSQQEQEQEQQQNEEQTQQDQKQQDQQNEQEQEQQASGEQEQDDQESANPSDAQDSSSENDDSSSDNQPQDSKSESAGAQDQDTANSTESQEDSGQTKENESESSESEGSEGTKSESSEEEPSSSSANESSQSESDDQTSESSDAAGNQNQEPTSQPTEEGDEGPESDPQPTGSEDAETQPDAPPTAGTQSGQTGPMTDDDTPSAASVGQPLKPAQAINREEAMKMLQAIRDRDLKRRTQKLNETRRRHRPVDRDW